ncbi:Major facilitator super domain-containing protein 7 [Physocladia obscura]|uniref:Major facilitator super domain-containing protein 7 n=1 Tax=Physocladia obscura TaxID=109957 RepID=A0AAD5XAT1_9FUNG|nr:Major facilitator super domain-containing protein 7 [Physocladia obscura]
MASAPVTEDVATTNKEIVDVEIDSAGAATNQQFRLYPWRFAVVAGKIKVYQYLPTHPIIILHIFAPRKGIFLITFSNTMNFSTYGAVTPTVAQHYNTDTTTITSLNMWNLIAFFPAIYPATWLLDTHGLRPALISAASINAFGCFLRWITVASSDPQTKIRLLYAGSALIGFSSPFTIDGALITSTYTKASTKCAAHWFSGNGRLLANAVMSLGSPLGGAAGLFLSPALVSDAASAVDTLNLVYFVLAAVLGLASLAVFNAPPTPPSESARRGTVAFTAGLKLIAKNGPFWVLATVFTGVNSTFQLMSTYVSNYVTPYGFSESDSGNFGVVFAVVGIIGALIIGAILDRTKGHIQSMKYLAAAMVLGSVGFYVGTVQYIGALIYIAVTFLGGGALPLFSVSFELGAECTYPVAEATSTGILMMVSQFVSIILFVVTNALVDPTTNQLWRGMIILIVLAGMSFVMSLFYKTENRRMVLENHAEMEREQFTLATRTESAKISS